MEGATKGRRTMTIIVFNGLAVGMAVGYAIQAVTGPVGGDNALAAAIAFGLAASLDVIHRWKEIEVWGPRSIYHPDDGGHIDFVPHWAMMYPC